MPLFIFAIVLPFIGRLIVSKYAEAGMLFDYYRCGGETIVWFKGYEFIFKPRKKRKASHGSETKEFLGRDDPAPLT